MASLDFYVWTPWYADPIEKPFAYSQLQVEGDETPSPSDRPFTFRSTDLIHDHSTRVYRGIFTGRDGQEISAVCKFVREAGPKASRRFHHEAKMYQTKLRDLQGHCIPRFYGLYSGQFFGNLSMCIILEDCGECVGSYDSLSMDWRRRAVEVLMAIHKRGVRHNDYSPRNLVVDNKENPTRLVAIDFEYASLHECNPGADIELYAFPPAMADFHCDELYDVADFTRIWTPDILCIFGEFVRIDWFSTPEELLAVAPDYDDLYEYDEALSRAKAAIRDYNRRWDSRKDYMLGNVREVLSPAM